MAKLNKEWTKKDFEIMRRDWGNNSLVGWKLIYTDGIEIRSTECSFNDARQDGVQVLIKYYKRAKGGYSKEIQNGLDMYVLYSEQPLELDLPPEIKKGENLPMSRFEEILAYARADKEMVTSLKYPQCEVCGKDIDTSEISTEDFSSIDDGSGLKVWHVKCK